MSPLRRWPFTEDQGYRLSPSTDDDPNQQLDSEEKEIGTQTYRSLNWRQMNDRGVAWLSCKITFLILLSSFMSALVAVGTALALVKADSNSVGAQNGRSSDALNAPFRPTPRLRHCGANAEEARILGCKFQIWSYSWVPPECYDEELVNDWLSLRDWEYYDKAGPQANIVNFTTEVLHGEGDRTLYSTWGQHYWRCAFSWRKFIRAALGSGVGITDKDLDYHHANHCQETVLKKASLRPWEENDIELEVGYHKC